MKCQKIGRQIVFNIMQYFKTVHVEACGHYRSRHWSSKILVLYMLKVQYTTGLFHLGPRQCLNHALAGPFTPSEPNKEDESDVADQADMPSTSTNKLLDVTPSEPNTEDEPDEADPADILSTSLLNVWKGAIMAQRVGAREGLLQQAKRMKRDSDTRCPVPEIGATVRVPIPSLDRGKIDDRSVLA